MRFLTLITALLSTSLGLLATPCYGNEKASSAAAPATTKILAFGDSLTAGYRLPTSQAYPAQLESMLNQEGVPAKVTNAGVSGDTSAQALRRVDWSLKNGRYDMVLICLGANDGLRRLPLADLESNLSQMIEKFRKAGLKTVVIGIRLPSNFPEAYRKGFEELYPRVAKAKGADFLPFLLEGVAMEDALNLSDRIHPNEKGQKIVARRIADFLKPKLRKAAG